MSQNKFIAVFSTISSQKAAEKIAVRLVEEKLAACVNITSKIKSVYAWKGKLYREGEFLMLIKTRQSLYARLEKRLKSLHPYETPEIIALPILKGSPGYLSWLTANTVAR
ncbi:MAG: divalent-cation tolerance protein CutA [bacterium]